MKSFLLDTHSQNTTAWHTCESSADWIESTGGLALKILSVAADTTATASVCLRVFSF